MIEMKTLIVISLAILAGTVGDILLSKGMKQVGEISTLKLTELVNIGLAVFTNPTVLLGVGCLAIYFFLFIASLSWADVSLVVPLTAFSYVLTTFFARLILHEPVSLTRWAGTLFIALGVVLVSQSGRPG